ncbi:T9SS type A sorting domain-containing protein [Flavobacteriales bacterium]|nr:T9SS type A sorting domain-containing protein [Flavobacteriales bacterium]
MKRSHSLVPLLSLLFLHVLFIDVISGQSFESLLRVQDNGNENQITQAYTVAKYNEDKILVAGRFDSGNSVWDTYGYGYLAMIDQYGNVEKQKQFTDPFLTSASRIEVVSENEIFIVSGLEFDGLVVKLDSNLNVQWSKLFGDGVSGYYDRITSIKQTVDGNYICVGTSATLSDSQAAIFVLKINSFGDIIWSKGFGLGGDEDGADVVEINGYFYVLGYGTGQYGYTTPYLLNINQSGDLIWGKAMQLSGGSAGSGRSLIKKKEEDKLIIATSMNQQIVLMEMDTSGNVLWTKKYQSDFLQSYPIIYHSVGGNYIFSSSTVNTSGGFGNIEDPIITQVNQNGDLLWSKFVVDTARYDYDWFWSGLFSNVAVTSSSIAFVGTVYDKMYYPSTWEGGAAYISMYNQQGQSQCSDRFLTVEVTTPDLEIEDITASFHIESGANSEAYFFRDTTFNVLSNIICDYNIMPEVYKFAKNVNVYPNPSNGVIYFKGDGDYLLASLTIYDVLGNELLKTYINNRDFTFSGEQLASGMYFYAVDIMAEDEKITEQSGKFILNKNINQ